MKTHLVAVTAVLAASAFAQIPEMPKPGSEHQWLQKFVGNWESEMSIFMEPGKPPLKAKGTETARMIGGFWIVDEGKSEMMGAPFNFVLTLGYDPEKKKYVGTWVDSMSSYLWKYEGSVDAAGKVLTLESQGPCPKEPGRLVTFKEVTEFKSDDHRIFTSSMQEKDGKWTVILQCEFKRKK